MTFEGNQSSTNVHVHEKKHRVGTRRIEGKQGPMLNHFEGKTKRVRVRSDKYIRQTNNWKEKQITKLLRAKTKSTRNVHILQGVERVRSYSTFCVSKMFSSHLRAQNLFSSKGFVKISANCSSVRTWLIT